jgi:cellulase/cellobiase CelA1
MKRVAKKRKMVPTGTDSVEPSKWYNWIYIDKSGFKDAGLGVYVAHGFPKGVGIGFHVAKSIC